MQVAGGGFPPNPPLLREHLIRFPDLDAVSLVREHDQRLILRFPSETRDRTVVPATVGCAVNPKLPLVPQIRLHVRQNRGVINHLNQAATEYRRGNSQAQVVLILRLREILLREHAPRSVEPSLNRE